MSYLLDKKTKRKKFFNITLAVAGLVVLFYFRSGIFSGLSYVVGGVFRPVLVFGNNVGDKFKGLGLYFSSKISLYRENENLKSQILKSEADRANYSSVVAENTSLKEILDRKDQKAVMILSAILSKPNKSPYDTLIVDVGMENGVKTGDLVFALGNIPIGRIAEAYLNSSKIILFSSSGEKTQAVLGNNFLELVGRGGGNFEVIIPRDLNLTKGEQAVLPGLNSYVAAIVETIISDPRDPFTKALLVSPVNIQELKFVEIEI